MVDIGCERDIETVRQVALLLDRENGRLMEQNKKFRLEIAVLQGRDPASLQIKLDIVKELLALRERALFGRSSEKRPAPEGEAASPLLPTLRASACAGSERGSCFTINLCRADRARPDS